jgi:hypothetical protein
MLNNRAVMDLRKVDMDTIKEATAIEEHTNKAHTTQLVVLSKRNESRRAEAMRGSTLRLELRVLQAVHC